MLINLSKSVYVSKDVHGRTALFSVSWNLFDFSREQELYYQFSGLYRKVKHIDFLFCLGEKFKPHPIRAVHSYQGYGYTS